MKPKQTMIILMVAFLVAGLGLSIYGLYTVRRGFACSSWPTVDGKVDSSSVTQKKNYNTRSKTTSHTYEPSIRYSYQAAGRNLSGTRISFADHASGSEKRARRIADRYPTGKTVSVHHDPRDPTISVLETSVTFALFLPLLGGLIFLAVSILMVVLLLRSSS